MKGATACLQNIQGEGLQNAMMTGKFGARGELELFGKQIMEYA